MPVATMSLGKAGAKNAGIFAAQIVATADVKVANRLKVYKVEMERDIEEKARKLTVSSAEPAAAEEKPVAESAATNKKTRRRRWKKKAGAGPSQGSAT